MASKGGLFAARIMKVLAASAGPAANVYAAQQYQAPPKKKRGKKGCTPCAAIDAVIAARKDAGLQ